jgi:hypothetical protein
MKTTIERHPPKKLPYKKSEAIKLLMELALTDNKIKYPSFPEEARYIKPYSDKTANELTRAIIDYLKLSGHQAERVAVTGRYIDQSKLYKDTLGFTRRIGSGKWIKSSMQPGSSDISATINGRSVKIEIKIGRDRQSEDQKKYQAGVEKAGGYYLLVRSFEEFLTLINEIE